jgi:hypothetical protein
MIRALKAARDPAALARLREETRLICTRFPVPGINPSKKAQAAAA